MSDDLESDKPRDAIRASRPEAQPAATPRRQRRDDDDYQPPPRGGSGGTKTLLIILGLVGLLGFCLVAAVIGGLIFAVSRVRNAAATMQTQNNYKQIVLAMHNYHDARNQFPPVAMPTSSGKPGLSWRVAILPYLESNQLYMKFKIDEPWDSPANKRAAAEMPNIYAPYNRAGGDQTHVRLFVGPGAIYDPTLARPRRMFEITDGTSSTFLLVESTQSVLWTQPEELTFDPKGPVPALGLPNNDYFMAATADGDARRVKKSVRPEAIKAWITANAGDTANLDD
jgi:hypothetical protein